jgi:hypothetical protein
MGRLDCRACSRGTIKKHFRFSTRSPGSQYLGTVYPSQPQYLESLLGDMILAMTLTYLTVAWWGIGYLVKAMLIG